MVSGEVREKDRVGVAYSGEQAKGIQAFCELSQILPIFNEGWESDISTSLFLISSGNASSASTNILKFFVFILSIIFLLQIIFAFDKSVIKSIFSFKNNLAFSSVSNAKK
jgi:hypothetical protein